MYVAPWALAGCLSLCACWCGPMGVGWEFPKGKPSSKILLLRSVKILHFYVLTTRAQGLNTAVTYLQVTSDVHAQTTPVIPS